MFALYTEFNFKVARYGSHGHYACILDSHDPMVLRYDEGDEAGLPAMKQQRNICRYYKCGGTNIYLRADPS